MSEKNKIKYIELTNQLGERNKNIIFLFFNGGGLSYKQWYEHPFKKNKLWLNRIDENKTTKLINKIKNFGDIYLNTPLFYLTKENIINSKSFTIADLNLTEYCKKIYNEVKKYDKIFIISHSRGYILANFFCKLYSKKVIAYINIDGGDSNEWYKKN